MLNIKNWYKNKLDYFEKIIKSFGLTEKTIFIIFSIIFIISSLSLLWKVDRHFMTEVPAHGGSLSEGLIGSPRFINPLLELSDPDRDLTYLIYSGLMRATTNGDLIPDLAESYTVSADGLTYDFKIKSNAYFQDGVKVTADDIEYTIQMVQDVNLRSPKRNSWVGVDVQKINEREIIFKLKQPYSPFIENTTLGILPKHIWNSASADEFPFSLYNVEPIGSGPYKISQIKRNNSGIPTSYELKSFSKYTLGQPYIDTINFNFYPNEKNLIDAYETGQVESTSALLPQSFDTLKNKDGGLAEKISLPRVFGVFFNQNQAKIFLNKEVRQALSIMVDKDRIVNEVLNGYGQKIDGPLPNGIIPNQKVTETIFNKEEALKQARDLLTKASWKFNEADKVWEKKVSKTETQKLVFSLSTGNTADLKSVANILKENWESLGIKVDVQTFDPSDLNQSVIGQRKYDALLFGEIINRSLDLFAFWHSSQRNDPGLNISMYANSRVDKLLEDARKTQDIEARIEKYVDFEKEIKKDTPAIFLYSPNFIYITPSKIKGLEQNKITMPFERFLNINKWYIETNNLWKIFL